MSALTVLRSLKREFGDLDRVTAWLIVYRLVNADPDFTLTTNVIDRFSDLILEVYGPEAGMHARMAPGLAAAPLGMPVTIAAEVALSGQHSDFQNSCSVRLPRAPSSRRSQNSTSTSLGE